MPNSILDKVMAMQDEKKFDTIVWEELRNALFSYISEKERAMIEMRYGLSEELPATLEEIGTRFKITRERVRQIIRLAEQKITKKIENDAVIAKVLQYIKQEIQKYGGLISVERMLNSLAQQEYQRSILKFLLDSVRIIDVERVANEGLKDAWKISTVPVDSHILVIDMAEKLITDRGALKIEDIHSHVSASQHFSDVLTFSFKTINDIDLLTNLIELSSKLSRSVFGLWGYGHDPIVAPRRMSDKIYLVLKHTGKPMHFRDITETINQLKFDTKIAYPSTIHNELILDNRYVLVGRGLYALSEWGYVKGVVADIIADILTKQPRITRDHIEEAVMKQRVVKPGTIYLALTNRSRFIRHEDGTFSLAANSESTPHAGVAESLTQEQIES